jgi:hypothetical protein
LGGGGGSGAAEEGAGLGEKKRERTCCFGLPMARRRAGDGDLAASERGK